MQQVPELDRMTDRAKPDDIQSEGERNLTGYEISKRFKSRPKARMG